MKPMHTILQLTRSLVLFGVPAWLWCVSIALLPLSASSQAMSPSVSLLPGAVGTAITYQGRLNQGSTAANGQFDFQFSLYDAETGGNVVGIAQSKNAVTVVNGAFTVALDFGANVFSGAPRWLEIQVRAAGVGEFVKLAPRQLLAPVPYAIYAESVNMNSIQSRVTGVCADGSSIRTISPDGTVVCETDDAGGGNTHDHLGQTWTASGNPLTIAGSVTGLYNAPLILNNLGNGSGLVIKALGSSDANGMNVENNSDYATIYAENKSTGSGISVVAKSGNAIYAESSGAAYPTIYVTNTNTGGNSIGVITQVKSGNALYAKANGDYDAVYIENQGTGVGISGGSRNGVGGLFWTGNNVNIIEAYDATSFDPVRGNLKFRVLTNGDVKAAGALTGGGADFAELLSAQLGLEPGDVLVVGLDGKLTHSSLPNAINVAGVYSTKPGFLGGSESDPVGTATTTDVFLGKAASASQNAGNTGTIIPTELEKPSTIDAASPSTPETTPSDKIPLAILGVVPVKVTDENGPIQPGDLLTTSSLSGHAMKAMPVNIAGVEIHRPGTIIGKALESWESGTGVISVLVSLQ